MYVNKKQDTYCTDLRIKLAVSSYMYTQDLLATSKISPIYSNYYVLEKFWR